MRFTKMHGIGNDYVYVNGFIEQVADPAALAPIIANRHTGVGGDGLILVLPPTEGTDAHVRMRMFNADGSESEMCGNGVRCVCKFAHDRALSTANPMRIETGRGVLTLSYTTDALGMVDHVTVDMGEPILEPAKVPVGLPDLRQVVNHSIRNLIGWPANLPASWISDCGLDQRMTCVSMGNPHVIFFCKDVAKVPLEYVGPVVENHPVFPRRINVHFVQVHSRHEVTMRTWERGSGITLACGTGASAVCAAGVLTDHTDRLILAHLPGGDLTLEWKKNNHLEMTGPAAEVFSGEWNDHTKDATKESEPAWV
ncbi:MAG: diaminopimelate epimerase [Phycisphaeraceae bacterium]